MLDFKDFLKICNTCNDYELPRNNQSSFTHVNSIAFLLQVSVDSFSWVFSNYEPQNGYKSSLSE